jgi:hypothetical protein
MFNWMKNGEQGQSSTGTAGNVHHQWSSNHQHQQRSTKTMLPALVGNRPHAAPSPSPPDCCRLSPVHPALPRCAAMTRYAPNQM